MKKFKLLKKLTAMVLSAAMIMSMSASVFATDKNKSNGTYYTDGNGEEFFVPTTDVTSIAPQIEGYAPITTRNYHSDWQKVPDVVAHGYNGIVKIITTFNTYPYNRSGTGFMVAHGVILTSAHVLYDKGQWATSVKVEFRRNGDSCYKSYTVPRASMAVPDEWLYGTDNEGWDRTYDYARIKVPTSYTDGGTKFGLHPNIYKNFEYTITGYPNSSPFNALYMYTDKGYATNVELTIAKHDIDIMSGVSGAPMYASNLYAAGIQSIGWSNVVVPGANPDLENGVGGWVTPITQAVVDFARA